MKWKLRVYSNLSQKEIVSAVFVIGKSLADHNISVQQERMEGANMIGISSLNKKAADYSLAVMTYITMWMK